MASRISYKDLCTLNCNYITKKYGKPIVVFDGYEGLSTKNLKQERRTARKVGATVTFTEDMKATIPIPRTNLMLSYNGNCLLFIKMLSQFLQNIGWETRHAQDDADVLIVKTAVESARSRPTVQIKTHYPDPRYSWL
jgi:hypothetical protein